MPTNINNFKFKWSIVFRKQIKEAISLCLIQDFEADFLLSMESQPQNPEFRNNPEHFHPCSG